jgi:hypothetical protein
MALKNQMDSMLPKKGMSYGELIVDNILGLDNDYESFGEKLGKAVDEDELGFLKNAAVGVYEGAKEFITNPVETTKEVVTNIKDSVQRLGTEDLDTRLKSMYGVDYTQATDEQVNAAREAVIGDALTAMELIPAAKVTVSAAKAGSAAIPSGVKADVVGQTKALLSGDTEFLKGTPTERSGTVGVGAEVVGQDDVSLDDITDYMDSEVEPIKSKKQTNPLVQEIDYNNYNTSGSLFDFRSSVLGSLDNLAIGKDGMSGFQIKKFLEKRAPKINKTELYWSGLLENLDDNKKYSRLELENIADRNVPKVDIQVLDGSQVRYRNEQRVNLNVNNNVMQPLDGYKEIIIVNKNTKGTEYSAGHYDIMFEPDGNVLAHVRGSFVENNEPDFPIKEKFFLVEELQSDAVQQHTVADKAITKKIKEEKTSKPTLGDIGLYYQTEIGSTIYSSFVQGLDFTDKFVKDIDRYNYNFRSITDGDTGAQAINLGLTKIIDDMTKLKSGFVDGNRNKDAIAVILSREYGLKENSIKRRSIEELDEVDNIFANVLSDYVFGKSAARKYNKENNNELKKNLIETFKGINITAGLEKDLVPAKLSDTIRMSLLAVIKESKSEGVNKIYIPTPKVISNAHALSLEAAKNTYSDGVRKVLRTLNNETNGKIKFKNKNPENISYFEDKNSVGIEIDITDFNLPDNPQFRFAKGGVVKDMDNQMKMAFMNEGGLKDDGMKRDPVSGNEIPNGSMASEVRDDIPAQLSEGEYVVPADVVRFFGIKFFEDLRSKAKRGLQSMEDNGRIGGEPVPMETGELSDEEFAKLLQQELGGTLTTQSAEPIKAAEGKYVSGQAPSFNPDDYFLGFSGTPKYTPPAAVGTEPVVETEASCAAKGMVLGPAGVCIVAPQAKNNNDNDGPIVPAPAAGEGQGLGGAWYGEDEQKMLNDPEAYIKEQLARGQMLDSGLAKAGTMLLPGGLGLVLGGVNLYHDTKGIANARTALMVAKARGTLSAEKIKSLEDEISEDTKGNFIVDKDGQGIGVGTGINQYKDYLKELGFTNTDEIASGKNKEFLEATNSRAAGFVTEAKSRETGFVSKALQNSEKRKAMLDQINKRSKEKQAEIAARPSSGSDNDDRQSAADAMRDRQDRMARAEGQSGGFQGSATGSAVYAGGNRAEGGLMLKKKRKKK